MIGESKYSIEVNNLSKKFGSFLSVDGINFNVKQGEIFGFLGANGAGKSTTIKMLCGILEPTSGDALVAGYSIKNEPDLVKLNIGYMSQRFSLYNDLTVEENLNFFGKVYGLFGEELIERKKWALDIANLYGKENALTGSLPGGIKQRLALGAAVIHKPKIVFLDEPTSGVDPISRRSFWDLIHFLSENGMTVFVTTHYLEEAEFCHNIILIDSGKLIAEGTPKELKTKSISTTIFELGVVELNEAMEILENSSIADDVSIFGTTLHVALKREKNELQLTQLLSSKGISVITMSKISPSLEDVFIHLTSKKSESKTD